MPAITTLPTPSLQRHWQQRPGQPVGDGADPCCPLPPVDVLRNGFAPNELLIVVQQWRQYDTAEAGQPAIDQARGHNKSNQIFKVDGSSVGVTHDANSRAPEQESRQPAPLWGLPDGRDMQCPACRGNNMTLVPTSAPAGPQGNSKANQSGIFLTSGCRSPMKTGDFSWAVTLLVAAVLVGCSAAADEPSSLPPDTTPFPLAEVIVELKPGYERLDRWTDSHLPASRGGRFRADEWPLIHAQAQQFVDEARTLLDQADAAPERVAYYKARIYWMLARGASTIAPEISAGYCQRAVEHARLAAAENHPGGHILLHEMQAFAQEPDRMAGYFHWVKHLVHGGQQLPLFTYLNYHNAHAVGTRLLESANDEGCGTPNDLDSSTAQYAGSQLMLKALFVHQLTEVQRNSSAHGYVRDSKTNELQSLEEWLGLHSALGDDPPVNPTEHLTLLDVLPEAYRQHNENRARNLLPGERSLLTW